jgi:hypothetical protein
MYMYMCPRQVPPADMETGALAALTNKKYRVTRVGPLVYAGIQYMLTQWPGKNGKYASWLKVPSTLPCLRAPPDPPAWWMHPEGSSAPTQPGAPPQQ